MRPEKIAAVGEKNVLLLRELEEFLNFFDLLGIRKTQTRRKTSKLAPLVALIVLLTIPLYYRSIKESSKRLYETSHAYESLEDSIGPTSHLDSPPRENSNKPCPDGSLPCNEGDKVVRHHESVAMGTEHEKGPTSHLGSPLGENRNNPCSGDSAHCDEHEGGGDMATHHHEPVNGREKHKNEPRLDSPTRENNNKPCSVNLPQCNEGRAVATRRWIPERNTKKVPI
ncbi:hypothetical protein BUALT_Bualt16G0027400 [Buddleja alternifolia]|uniref:Uncharacterized protein n=1 Tax=Buddleja alternifolia TaxID=168488 RepID=A0AAV6WJ61_9LAMI|nr:hypothetical protein BUALT_Bualt16G0027400 [Buddleja alternifolia]